MTEQCNRCRFWFADPKSPSFDEEPHTHGKCRRHPPRISDHLASIAIGAPSFGQSHDLEDYADSWSVHRSVLFPVTFCTDWCGEFASAEPETSAC